jgi:BirA family biotin operon repressor/biotin-[acetyl-CoA-carboxylase] ligase
VKSVKKVFKNRRIFELNVVDSTNSYASELPPGMPEGSIVWALNQIKGRGQGDSRWESEPGKNLTFSIILYPTFLKAVDQFYISKVISLAIVDLLTLFTDRVSIKWPNDIYAGDKKIAGILIENSVEFDNIKQSIAGIGINLNQKIFASDAPNPLSLAQITGKEYGLKEMLEKLCALIENRYILIKDNGFQTIDDDYVSVLYRFNEPAIYLADGKAFKGRIIGVEPSGIIVVRDNDGIIRKFLHKEVEYVR